MSLLYGIHILSYIPIVGIGTGCIIAKEMGQELKYPKETERKREFLF